MASYGMSWLVVLLCVIWMSQDSLKVTCTSPPPTEADVIAMKAAVRKAIDAGKGPDEPCKETGMIEIGKVVIVKEYPAKFASVMSASVADILQIHGVSKESVEEFTRSAEAVGGLLCSLKEHLVCLNNKCVACNDLTQSQSLITTFKSTCEAGAEIAPDFVSHTPKEADVVAMRRELWKGLEAGKGAGEECNDYNFKESKFGPLWLELSLLYAEMVSTPLRALRKDKELTKEVVNQTMISAESNGKQLCKMLEDLVCVNHTCVGCESAKGLTEDQELVCKAAKDVQGATKETEVLTGSLGGVGGRSGSLGNESSSEKTSGGAGGKKQVCSTAALMVVGFFCVCVGILHSAFFM